MPKLRVASPLFRRWPPGGRPGPLQSSFPACASSMCCGACILSSPHAAIEQRPSRPTLCSSSTQPRLKICSLPSFSSCCPPNVCLVPAASGGSQRPETHLLKLPAVSGDASLVLPIGTNGEEESGRGLTVKSPAMGGRPKDLWTSHDCQKFAAVTNGTCFK